jgi:hypothetical protein
MSALSITSVVKPGFALVPSHGDGGLSIRFSGNGDMSAITTVAAYLQLVHSEAQRLKVNEVLFDLTELQFMNSSCFKSFVTWIDTVKNDPNGYRIRFLTDPKLHWQRRSLEALRRLAMGIVVVDSVSPQ